MSSFSNYRQQNRKERLNRSTNNGDMECLILTIFQKSYIRNCFLIEFQVANSKVRPNLSTNNGDKAERAKRPVSDGQSESVTSM